MLNYLYNIDNPSYHSNYYQFDMKFICTSDAYPEITSTNLMDIRLDKVNIIDDIIYATYIVYFTDNELKMIKKKLTIKRSGNQIFILEN